MAKTTSENLKLGIFVILGIALLLVAAYLIGNRQNMFGDTFPYPQFSRTLADYKEETMYVFQAST